MTLHEKLIEAAQSDPKLADLLHELRLDKVPTGCPHEWHHYGSRNGVPIVACQLCGVDRGERGTP